MTHARLLTASAVGQLVPQAGVLRATAGAELITLVEV
jgi:hypothetical protein